ncbi:YceI family protein [Legionella sp. km772]|uniref:YceI family protein n=1 Tax=Legionella sp. km772 TaxID=2498111 RepID=UPI000F8CD9E5|nr:YceI family protein [Legionella sp. km772]RUR11129.1 YceI family protein [Legionella sp. km772]
MRLKKIPYLSLALLTSQLYATPAQWEMIPSESQLGFTATQNDSPISGEFKSFTADLKVDVNDLKNSSIDIIIDMNSLNASYGEVKTTLLTPDWFNVKMFPKAEFKSTDFTKTGDNAYQAKGNLTIRDKTVPVLLTFTASFPSENKGMVEGSTVIKRSAFGVGQGEWASTDEIKDDVTVKFKVSAIKK